MCLQAHYRSELEFSWEGLQAAFVRLKRMVMGVEQLRSISSQPSTKPGEWWFERLSAFDDSVMDDLNTPKAIIWIDDVLGLKNVNSGERLAVIKDMDAILGLNLMTLNRTDLRIRPKAAVITEAETEAALAARKEARAAKDFAKSDAIRDDLIAKGVEVMDGDPLGWDWRLDI
jgi:cysteinyl-tRNA synthetase